MRRPTERYTGDLGTERLNAQVQPAPQAQSAWGDWLILLLLCGVVVLLVVTAGADEPVRGAVNPWQ